MEQGPAFSQVCLFHEELKKKKTPTKWKAHKSLTEVEPV